MTIFFALVAVASLAVALHYRLEYLKEREEAEFERKSSRDCEQRLTVRTRQFEGLDRKFVELEEQLHKNAEDASEEIEHLKRQLAASELRCQNSLALNGEILKKIVDLKVQVSEQVFKVNQ